MDRIVANPAGRDSGLHTVTVSGEVHVRRVDGYSFEGRLADPERELHGVEFRIGDRVPDLEVSECRLTGKEAARGVPGRVSVLETVIE